MCITGALRLFVAQLALNASFLPLVYRVKSRPLYVAMDTVSVVLTAATACTYTRISRPAGFAIV